MVTNFIQSSSVPYVERATYIEAINVSFVGCEVNGISINVLSADKSQYDSLL